MRVYLSSPYWMRCRLELYAQDLARAGHYVTSRWIRGFYDEYYVGPLEGEEARENLEDIRAADVLIVVTPLDHDGYYDTRGGHHFESGYALALGKRIFLVGDPTHIFHSLPGVRWFADWSQKVLDALEPAQEGTDQRQEFQEHLRAVMRGHHVDDWQAEDMVREITEWHDAGRPTMAKPPPSETVAAMDHLYRLLPVDPRDIYVDHMHFSPNFETV